MFEGGDIERIDNDKNQSLNHTHEHAEAKQRERVAAVQRIAHASNHHQEEEHPHFSDAFQQEEEVSEKVVKETVEKLNKLLIESNRRFEISIREKTREILIRLIDIETNEILNEIPPHKLVDAMANLHKVGGIMFDRTI